MENNNFNIQEELKKLPGKPGDTFGMKLCDIARALTCAVEAIAEHLLER